MRLTESARRWASRIKDDALTLWFALRHPDTPWQVKALCAVVVGYAFSPIDLIPDFIPVIGYLDDLLLLPLLIMLAIRLLPSAVADECRQQARERRATASQKPRSLIGAIVIVCVWLIAAAGTAAWLLRGCR